jgi:glycolate oxidase FAD binding subunit
MSQFAPDTAEQMADVLRHLAATQQTIQVLGKNSKRLMAGPNTPAQALVTTTGLRRLLQYERDDLTVSVEAGMPFSELQATLAKNGQMIALDPPFASAATVGGVIAANSSGPMRRLYGTARDLVIGMTFATLEGKLVKTGGMVVKNVAGLDLAKLMIGSFGTLAVITSINFRVHSRPPEFRTFLFSYKDADSAMQTRDSVLRGILQPIAVDLITPPAAARLGLDGYLLAVRAAGNTNVLKRYSRELAGATELFNGEEIDFWTRVREFSPEFMRRFPGGIVLRVSTTLTEMRSLLKLVSSACIARAGSGISHVYLTNWQGIVPIWHAARERGWKVVVEFAPEEIRAAKELWLMPPDPANLNGFGIMEKVKRMFDPGQLLNRSRLYGRI